MASKRTRLYCLESQKGGHRSCLPYSDFDPENRDFTLKAIRKGASMAGGGVILSCDAQQQRCYKIGRVWSDTQVALATAALAGTILVLSQK